MMIWWGIPVVTVHDFQGQNPTVIKYPFAVAGASKNIYFSEPGYQSNELVSFVPKNDHSGNYTLQRTGLLGVQNVACMPDGAGELDVLGGFARSTFETSAVVFVFNKGRLVSRQDLLHGQYPTGIGLFPARIVPGPNGAFVERTDDGVEIWSSIDLAGSLSRKLFVPQVGR